MKPIVLLVAPLVLGACATSSHSSLSNPRAPIHGFVYAPSWVEWSLMAGCFAAFGLLYMGFTKLFPIVSIWELEAVHGETAPAAGAPRLAEAES